MKNIPLNLLNVFVQSARLQSFKLAGENLSLTTSAVSQSIKKLEDLLGVILFLRRSNSVELTTKGQELLGYVENGLKEIEKGIQHIITDKRRITIFCPPAFSAFLMQPIILKLLQQGYEDIHLITHEDSGIFDSDRYDIAVLLDKKAKEIPDIVDLGPDVYYPFCHERIYEQIKHIDDFSKFLLIRNQHGRTSWDEWLQFNHLPINIAKTMTVSRATQLLSAIESGVGIGLESMRVIAPKLASGEYMILDIDNLKPIVKHMTWLTIAPHKRGDKNIIHIAQMICDHCSTDENGILTSA